MSCVVFNHTAARRLRPVAKLIKDQQQNGRASDNALKMFSSMTSSAISTTPPHDSLRQISPIAVCRRRPLSLKSLAKSVSFHSTAGLHQDATPDASKDDADAGGQEVQASTDEPTEIQYAFAPPAPLSEASKVKVKSIFDKFIWLDMIEVHMLTELIHEKMGVKPSAAAGGASFGASDASSGTQGGGADESSAENALKDVMLVGFDAKSKIKVIKEVRSIGGLGLKEAKELVESAPKAIQKGLNPEKAEEIKAQLEAVGAQVELV